MTKDTAQLAAAQHSAFSDLETPIAGVKHMSGIVATLAEGMLSSGNAEKRGGTLVYHFSPADVDEFLWAVYEIQDKARRLNEDYYDALEGRPA